MSDIYIAQGPPGMRGGPSQEAVERLNRRFDLYRNRHNDYEQRFVQSTNAINEVTKQETASLQKRFLEPKAKKGAKKSEKRKCEDSSAPGDSSSVPGRPSSAGGGSSEYYEPPKKIAISTSASKTNSNLSSGGGTGSNCNSPSSQSSMSFLSSPSGLSSSANSQPSMHFGRQNEASHLGSPKVDVKPDVSANSGELMRPGQPANSMRRVSDSPVSLNNSHIKAGSPMMTTMEPSQNSSNSCQQRNNYHPPPPPVREVKREDTSSKFSGFVDLEQCAAALEKDAAHNGGFLMSGLTGIGDYDPLMQDLISDISNNDFNFDDFEEPPHVDVKLGLNSLNMPPMPIRSLNDARPAGPPPVDTRPVNVGSVNKNNMNGTFHPMWQQQQQQQQGNNMYNNCNPVQSNQHSGGPSIMFQQQQQQAHNIHRENGPMKCHVGEAGGNPGPNLGPPPMQDLGRSQQHLRPPMGNQQAHLPPQQQHQQHMQNGWMPPNGRTGFIRPGGHNPSAGGFQPQQAQHYPNAPNSHCHQTMDLQNAQNARNWYHNNSRMPINNSNNFPDGYVDSTGAFVCRDSSYGYANRRT